jgi:predicted nucleic acid-binding protein
VRTAIDSNVISAIWSGESAGQGIVTKMGFAAEQGALLVCPAVFAELHAYPGATPDFVDRFFISTGISVDYRLEPAVWLEAGIRFARYAIRRRQSSASGPRRILADYLIGSHALIQADCLMTLDHKVYQQDFPELRLV